MIVLIVAIEQKLTLHTFWDTIGNSSDFREQHTLPYGGGVPLKAINKLAELASKQGVKVPRAPTLVG